MHEPGSVLVNPPDRLSFGRKASFGVGDFALNLYFTTASLYLLYFYTEVMGLDAATAGWVFAVALIWDATFDPVMGYLANRTRTRWGRYRPYLLFGAVPLAASWALIFLPTGLTGSALLLYAVGGHVLFRTLYAVTSMPYLALTAVLTEDSAERGLLASFRMVFAASCGLFAAALTLKFVSLFGGGQIGFFYTALLYGSISCALLIVVFSGAVERPVAEDQGVNPSARAMLLMLSRNRAFWLVSLAMLAGSIGGTVSGKTLPYYLKYGFGREDLIASALTASTAGAMLSIPLWITVMKRTSKRTMWLCGIALHLIAYPLLGLVPEQTQYWLPLLFVVGLGNGAAFLGFWGMVPDTVEYGAWRASVRAEGAIFGMVSLVQKGALGIGAALLGEMLGVIGYRANVAQAPATLANMKMLLIGFPFGAAVIMAIAIGLYPISPDLHRRLTAVLARRATRASAASVSR